MKFFDYMTNVYESENYLMPFIREERTKTGLFVYADIPTFGRVQLYSECIQRNEFGISVVIRTRYNPYAKEGVHRIRWREEAPVRGGHQ